MAETLSAVQAAQKSRALRRPRALAWTPGRRRGPSRLRCPYCLEDLTGRALDPPRQCPLCRHDIPDSVWGAALHCLSRAQEWDLLAWEMKYFWDAEHRDVMCYYDSMGSCYNPDLAEAKQRLFGMLIDKDAVLKLREEFLEAGGELDGLVAGFVQKRNGGYSLLACRILQAGKWRKRARALSAEGAGPGQVARYQFDYVGDLPWGVFGSPKRHEAVVLYLKKRLDPWGPG